MQERNHIIVLLLLAMSCMTIPIYLEQTLDPLDSELKRFDILQTIKIVTALVLASLFPLIRKVNDIYSISKELVVAMGMLLISAVGSKLVIAHGSPTVKTYLSTVNMAYVTSDLIFLITVVEPMWRLRFDPQSAAKREYADKVLLSRRGVRRDNTVRGNTNRNKCLDRGCIIWLRSKYLQDIGPEIITRRTSSSTVRDSTTSNAFNTREEIDEQKLCEENITSTSSPFQNTSPLSISPDEGWSFERLASTPMLASAFEEFARKALCHESVLFLVEVSRYRTGDFSSASESIGREADEFDGFCFISKAYIATGSPEEVNISFYDKMKILDQLHLGRESFFSLDAYNRRLFFCPAYRTVREMLEANLLQRFLLSKVFQDVNAQRENITTMMSSPV
ncbi:unnamed protein product [Choristocarpus tenellus]